MTEYNAYAIKYIDVHVYKQLKPFIIYAENSDAALEKFKKLKNPKLFRHVGITTLKFESKHEKYI